MADVLGIEMFKRWGKILRELVNKKDDPTLKDTTSSCHSECSDDFESITEEKRQWIDKNTEDAAVVGWPDKLFDSFVIVGLPPDIEITQIAEDLCDKDYRIRQEEDRSAHFQDRNSQAQSLSTSAWGVGVGTRRTNTISHARPWPAYEPSIVYKYSKGGQNLELDDKELIDLCFPNKVTPRKLKRTRSWSALHEVVFEKQLSRSDQGFIFMIKAGSSLPVYGVCSYVEEVLHRPPMMARDRFSTCNGPFRQCLISAPRCYCLVSRYPFFNLHFQVLAALLGMERLHRTVEFTREMSEHLESPLRAGYEEVSSTPFAVGSRNAASGLEGVISPPLDPYQQVSSEDVPDSNSLPHTSIIKRMCADALLTEDQVPKKMPSLKFSKKSIKNTALALIRRSSNEIKGSSTIDQDQIGGDFQVESNVRDKNCLGGPVLQEAETDHEQQQEAIKSDPPNHGQEQLESPQFHHGQEQLESPQFQPELILDKLHEVEVLNPGDQLRIILSEVSSLDFRRPQLGRFTVLGSPRQLQAYSDTELAEALQGWAVAAVARLLSLDNLLYMITAALLEKQIVVFCPDIAACSAVVLSLVPLLRPFSWQSLMMPVTPLSMMSFLDAPVPFILGLQFKTAEVQSRCTEHVRINVYKDQVNSASSIPHLPGLKQLKELLLPSYTILHGGGHESVFNRPLHVLTKSEETAAKIFTEVFQEHLAALIGDIRPHVITNVGQGKRTGVLMRDSLLESARDRDRPFISAFFETQLFSVWCDQVISVQIENHRQ